MPHTQVRPARPPVMIDATAHPDDQPTVDQSILDPMDTFIHRHIGPSEDEIAAMLRMLGYGSLDELTDATVPESIRIRRPLEIGPPRGEFELTEHLQRIAQRNRVSRSFIGMGYHDCITPPVIQRNILENPGWYTQYTPYQAEISQGRLEALLTFQTMIADLTGLPLAQASLLDEATAAAEAMAMCFAIGGQGSGVGGRGSGKTAFFVAQDCHPQTIAVLRTRARSLGIELIVGDPSDLDLTPTPDGVPTPLQGRGAPSRPPTPNLCGVLLQYPTTDGRIVDYRDLIERIHKAGALAVVAADPLALTLLTPPDEFGADIAVGSTQRFGVPMGYGGPHAAYLATKNEYARRIPGRIIGVSRDAQGNPAYRMAIQTREQHIKRERATSNICTAQALLAIMAAMYAVYHGPDGLRRIAQRIRAYTNALISGLEALGHETLGDGPVFDTLRVRVASWAVPGPGGSQPSSESPAALVHQAAERLGLNFRRYDDDTIGITLDETVTSDDITYILTAFNFGEILEHGLPARAKEQHTAHGLEAHAPVRDFWVESLHERAEIAGLNRLGPFERTTPYLTHPVFNTHHSETEMLRYIFRLQSRDLSLAQSMIPLGSCTMKLNATTEMLPVIWPQFARMHPFAPPDQALGYMEIFRQLEAWLCEITGFGAVSLQPNAGSQGEYAGLLVIRTYHESRGDSQRNVCLIPTSAHGTNPASAVIAGFRVVAVECDARGNVDLDDLRAKAQRHADTLGALMITYPSTHGVFEPGIRQICEIVHEHGGQVYLDGANMNAMVGLCRPADFGADVCHLNLHKTFCIPHGGGGPGMGPIGVAEHLAPFLPTTDLRAATVRERSSDQVRSTPLPDGRGSLKPIGAVAAAPYGSPLILTISWAYIALMGDEGLRQASQVAILNANYMARRLAEHYTILFTAAPVAPEHGLPARAKGSATQPEHGLPARARETVASHGLEAHAPMGLEAHAPVGLVAHEFILDFRPFEKSAGVKVEDVAKRLMDYGFHAPTMSFPVPGTLMIEPTESESQPELDRFCDALIAIREEIRAIEEGRADREDNVLRHAPHPIHVLAADDWPHSYSREQAGFPAAWLRDWKFWPPVSRIDNPYGDRNLMCTCPPVGDRD